MRIRPGRNRLIQVRRTGNGKRFDAARKAVFLEWFAATCNAWLSAAKAGVNYRTPFRHREKDPEFEAQWDAALVQAYPRIEARLLQEAHAPAIEVSDAVAAAAEEHFDPYLALQLLREHARRLPGSADKRKNRRTTPRVATNAEVLAALEKRLVAFARRQAKRKTGKK
ncbi:MAG TPA: hypothetical protein VF079_07820 [Sphingomicrobium sp.]